MNIILGEDNVKHIDERYVVLELDTIRPGPDRDPVRAYCVLEQISLPDVMTLERYRDLHVNLIKNYRLKNWQYCENALEHLLGHWGGALDSFYQDLSQRVKQYRESNPGDDWNWVLDRAAV